MTDKESLKRIIRNLLDEYPLLRKPFNKKRLVWCVWVKLGFATDYNLDFNSYLQAPTDSTILRIQRDLYEEHPPYKFSERQICPKKMD